MRVQGFGWIARIAASFAFVAASACGGGGGTDVVRVTGVRFGTVPSTLGAGVQFTVTVELTRSNGDVASGATNQVTLTLLNPGTAVLNGTTTVDAIDGVATFTGLSINQSGTGRQFHAATAELAVVSANVSVARGPAAQSQSSLTPPPGNVPPNAGAVLTFTFKDTYGNLVSNTAVSTSTDLPGSFLTPSSGTTNANGEFVTTFFSPGTGSAMVGAVVDGVPITGSGAYTVVNLCTTQPAAAAFPGTVNGTQPCGAYISTALAPSTYSFTAPGGGAAFTLNATYATRFEVTPDLTVPSVTAIASQFPSTGEWLLPAGNYFFRVGAVSGAGAFSVTTASVSANTGNVLRFLVAPGTFTGQGLAAGDENQFFGDGSFSDLYVLLSSRPCTLTVQTTAYDNFFVVFDAIDENAPALGISHPPLGQDAVLSLPACRSGNNPLLLVVNSFQPTGTGAYTLSVAFTGGGAMRASHDATSSVAPIRISGALRAALLSRMKSVRR
ncbi:MAG TPA: Ig-like domain-containing protein [Gemmatimonadaceae bacterium]|nr:Ig-like domain-containing protein [Gemmatimonadaceae bacterium]